MNPFSYSKPEDVSQAINLAGPASRFIAEGRTFLI